MTLSDVCFIPDLQETVFIPYSQEYFSVYATAKSSNVRIEANLLEATNEFKKIDLQAVGEKIFTFRAVLPNPGKRLKFKFSINDFSSEETLDGQLLVLPQIEYGSAEELRTEIILEDGQDSLSVKVPWIATSDWEGWAYMRSS